MPTTPPILDRWNSDATINGTWWPADQPHLRYPGTLNIVDGRSQLTVTAPPIGQEVFALGSTTTLHGETVDGSGVTLVTLWGVEGTHFHHDSETEHTRDVVYAVFGEHFDGRDSSSFRSSAASYHDLATWSRISDVIPAGTAEEDAAQHTVATLNDAYSDIFGHGYQVEVRLEHPQRLETSEWSPGGSIQSFRGDGVRVVFDVEPPAPALFHDLLLQDMQALLTFSYLGGAPITGQWLGRGPDNLRAVARRDTFRDRAFTHRGDFQMLLTTDVAPFGHLVEEWWRVLEERFPAPQVVTTYLHTSRGLLEQSTASVLAATENLHAQIGSTQVRFDPSYLADRHEEIRATYKGPAFAPFRGYLKEKFRDNRPTLQTRLDELIELVGTERFESMAIDSAAWCGLFKAVRNRLAHTGAHVPRRGDPSDDLELINGQTRIVLSMLLLAEMSLPASALDRAAQALGSWPHRVESPAGQPTQRKMRTGDAV